ncbi:hypothetical protein FB451DRAFT_1371995 [Mycena latifolia]|nr:hypothetical protein FB451DRAFT_1371995 [Mycena latifolia]
MYQDYLTARVPIPPSTMSIAEDASSNFQDMPESEIIPNLSNFSSTDLAPLVPLLVSWLVCPSSDEDETCPTRRNLSRETRAQLSALLILRLTAARPSTADPLVAEIHTILSTPSVTAESAELKGALFHWHGVLLCLPKDRIEVHRDALTRLALNPTSEEATYKLKSRCRYLLDFLDVPHAHAPHSKSDELAVRSLELVQTADEMRPLVPAVLEWIADTNWPVADGCWNQLARFPELTIDPIREVLRRGDDAGWECNLLTFLLRDVPRPLLEGVRPELERISMRPTDEEIECLVQELAAECLEVMDHWAARTRMIKISRVASPQLANFLRSIATREEFSPQSSRIAIEMVSESRLTSAAGPTPRPRGLKPKPDPTRPKPGLSSPTRP